MSQSDRFAGGFVLGAVLGGVVGGVLGVVLGQRSAAKPDSSFAAGEEGDGDREMGPLDSTRRSLEQKISQLSDAIDDVQEQLRNVPPLTELDAEE